MERISSQLSLSCEKAITSVDLGGPMINAERINSQLSLSREKAITSVAPGGGGGQGQIDSECREDQQSMCNDTVYKVNFKFSLSSIFYIEEMLT